MSDLIRYETAGRAAYVTLNRPDKRNALSAELVEQLQAVLDEASRDAAVRVIVLTGEGTAFSAGADLAALERMQSASALENEADSRQLADLFHQIYLHPKPVIARINGHAIAGGCGLAAVCDLSVAVDTARVGFTEVRIGFVPAIVMVFVLRKIGEAAARHLMLTGELISAHDAERIGLINETVPESKLDERVDELVQAISGQTSASAVRLTKQMMAQVRGMGLGEGLDYAARMNAFARGTDDCRAGIAAFLSRTDPPWKR